jgi:small-conductance mechanosensitive channel
MIDWLSRVSGTAITIAATVIVLIGGRLILNKAVKDKRTLPYHRQFWSLLLTIAGVFIAIALLPLPAEVRAQILSVLGILMSAIIALSSTTLVGNAMAGVMLRLTKGFRAGDFIQFDELLGRVTDIGLFHTEIQLITRDIVTVPNVLLARTAVRVTRKAGTFINVAVSIGYTEPHEGVETALKEAAESCELAEPFVLVEDLLDHAVCYRVYGLLEESSELLSRSSRLRSAILDTLHRHGIEIASPSLVDRREYGRDHQLVPPSVVPSEPESPSGDAIEGIAFDRAEEAASIEQLYAVQEKLNHDLETAGDQVAREQKGAIREQLHEIREEIKKREAQKEEERLDENASE